MKKRKKRDRSNLKIFLILIVLVAVTLAGALFVKYAVSGLLLSSTTYAVSTGHEKNIVAGCAEKLSGLSCSRWTTCEDGERTRTCRDNSGCLPYSGHFVQAQTCSVDVKTGSITTGPAIAEFCDSDSKCEKNENYFMCPNDCESNAEDDVCNDKTDGLCDPDCGTYDKDCIQSPKATKFSPALSTNLSRFEQFTLKNLELGIKDRGKILFKDAVDVSGADLDSYVNIGYNLISINLERLPELNVSARITLYNLVYNDSAVLFNGHLCKDNCRIRSYRNGTLVFDVKETGTFRAEEKLLAEQQFGMAEKTLKQATKWSVLNTIIIIIIAVLILLGAFYAYFTNYYKKLIPKIERKPKGKKKQDKEPGDFKLRPTKDLIEIKPYPKVKEHKEKKPAIPIVVVKKKNQKVQTIKPKTIVVKRYTIKPKRKSKVLFPVSKLPKLKIPKDPYKEERLKREKAAKKRKETMKKKERAKKKKQAKKRTGKKHKRKETKRKIKAKKQKKAKKPAGKKSSKQSRRSKKKTAKTKAKASKKQTKKKRKAATRRTGKKKKTKKKQTKNRAGSNPAKKKNKNKTQKKTGKKKKKPGKKGTLDNKRYNS
ncbi:hypothetical protein GF371_02720, partial [Candidatus Woesearchaeota archaeon]|nr:hypothetical protein [Candidatus Woesearchaeota archaeon]